jgi:hypothetical protein
MKSILAALALAASLGAHAAPLGYEGESAADIDRLVLATAAVQAVPAYQLK